VIRIAAVTGRSCFGELVQIDASIPRIGWRGVRALVLISMIDDATSASWHVSIRGTVETHMELGGAVAKAARPAVRCTRQAQHL